MEADRTDSHIQTVRGCLPAEPRLQEQGDSGDVRCTAKGDREEIWSHQEAVNVKENLVILMGAACNGRSHAFRQDSPTNYIQMKNYSSEE